MLHVVTYHYPVGTHGITRTLCDRHAQEETSPLGQVQKGRRVGYCDYCDRIHVTGISGRNVYGHHARHCDPGGCAAGPSLYFADLDPAEVEVGGLYERDGSEVRS